MLYDFYVFLMLADNSALTEAYAVEFMDELLNELDDYNSFYTSPVNTEKIIALLKRLKSISAINNYIIKIEKIIAGMEKSFEIINKILNGENIYFLTRISYPLLETNGELSSSKICGILETITTKIEKGKERDSFIYIPSLKKVDGQLEKQAKISFKLALSHLSSYNKKFYTYHEILIYFENKTASYEGNSLGIALTIAFIEELTKFYNLPHHINIKENIASTGGLDNNGNILPVSTNHIQQKIETVFYSPIEYFVIPAQDEKSAFEKLQTLKETYPNRNLKLIPIENINDLLDRRSLIDIKKQPRIIRAARSMKNNWLLSLVATMLLGVLAFFAIRDLDNNPASFEFQSDYLVIKNKSGQFLWRKQMNGPLSKTMGTEGQKQLVKLVDINNDGVKEVLVCAEKQTESEKAKGFGKISCYDNKGSLIWPYIFNDSVKTRGNTYKNNFIIRMIDTLTENNRKVLYLFACDSQEYPSAIFKVDLQTGTRLAGELWNPGSIYSALIKDVDNDGRHEIVVGCVNNALKLPCVFSVKTTNLYGANYSTPEYEFIGKEPSKLENCLFLPKTDYTLHQKEYINQVVAGSLEDNPNEGKLRLNVSEGINGENAILIYKLTYDFKPAEIIVNSHLRVRRDSLVAGGILKPPFTDTKEYTNMLKSQVQSWDGKRFTKGAVK